MLGIFRKKDGGEAKNWYKDRYQAVLVQRNVLALITVLSLSAVLLANLAVSQLAPVKSVEPFVIQVEDKTGIAEVVKPLSKKEISNNEALNQYFVAQFLRAHESYEPGKNSEAQEIVRVMSEPEKVYRAYVAERSSGSPNSLVNKLANKARRSVKFKSIVFLDPTRAQVRVILEDYYFQDGKTTQRHMIAFLQFEYTDIKLTTEERYINPLGFRVVNYRLDEDNIQR